jgi:hypothetical protein
MKKKETAGIPEFKSLEEERAYWEARGPLAEGNEWKLHVAEPGQRRASFLNIRLTGKELTQLRNIAGKYGMGPSTYARQVLKTRINQEQAQLESSDSYLPPVNGAMYARESASNRVNMPIQSGICIFYTGNSKVNLDIMQSLLDMLNKICACKILSPGDPAYRATKKLLNNDVPFEKTNHDE